MRISCLQYTAEANFSLSEARVYSLMQQAVEARAQVILLPECALYLSTTQCKSRSNALNQHASEISRFRCFASEHQVTLIIGSLLMRVDDVIKNRLLVINASGDIQTSYDKIHLFDVDLSSGERYRESALIEAGHAPQMTAIANWQVGLSICFDLRFPGLYRYYALEGADLIVVPAAFTRTTGEAHWHTLLRARAIENGCFVAAAGLCGVTLEGRETYGHSVVYDPWGTCIGELGVEPGCLTVDLDQSLVKETRSRLPVIVKHREFY